MCTLRVFIVLVLLSVADRIWAQNATFQYDNAGNRVKRIAGGGSSGSACYELRMASNQKRITNVNDILKVKDLIGSGHTQIWKLEPSGSHYKIVAQDGTGRVMGVANGGNAYGNLITLQTFTGADHQLWTRQLVNDGNPGDKYGFIRKNSTLIICSQPNWGDGDPSDNVTDMVLTHGSDLEVFGKNKFFLDAKTCPVARLSAEGGQGVAKEENEPAELSVSPNPNNGEFYASFYLAEAQKATLLVFDIKGQMLQQHNIKGQGAHRERIDIGTAAAGTYIVALRRQNGTETKRVVVIK